MTDGGFGPYVDQPLRNNSQQDASRQDNNDNILCTRDATIQDYSTNYFTICFSGSPYDHGDEQQVNRMHKEASSPPL
jgi:hypothetical protein